MIIACGSTDREQRITRICWGSDLDFLHEALIDYPVSINWTEQDKQVVLNELACRMVCAE